MCKLFFNVTFASCCISCFPKLPFLVTFVSYLFNSPSQVTPLSYVFDVNLFSYLVKLHFKVTCLSYLLNLYC